MIRHRFTDEPWDCISDLCPPTKPTGRPPVERRRVIDGVLWILQTGSPWRDMPADWGSWRTPWRLFDPWNANGLLDAVLDHLRNRAGIDNPLWCIDGTSIRVARGAGGVEKKDPQEPEDHALGRSRGGFSTKIHLLCDGQGPRLHFEVTPGQTHEAAAFDTLLEAADERMVEGQGVPIAWPVALAADKGYRAHWIDEYLLDLGITPVIPSKENENRGLRPVMFDKDKYRDRNIVERLIGWLKECRRVFSRFEKTAKKFAGMIKRACIQRYTHPAQVYGAVRWMI